MKRFVVLVCAMSLVAAGCDKSISPAVPTGLVTLVAQLAGASNVPPAGYLGGATALEAGATGSLQMTMTPTTGGDYTASFSLSLRGLLTQGVLPYPLDNGSAIVAGYVHQGAAGALGAPVVALPISQTAPILSPTGTVLITINGVTVTSAVASGILANPAGYYFNLYSGLNTAGVLRGQLVRQ
ncbi:MAG: CHRD domain-containing protein [Acidobacteria bacterium]|nr:CHRD domain-containing protein [Acidobacteriota bacterium]